MEDNDGWIDAEKVAGMTPYLFDYDGPDGKYGITLYGTDPKQILEENCDQLKNLRLCGELICTKPAFGKGDTGD